MRIAILFPLLLAGCAIPAEQLAPTLSDSRLCYNQRNAANYQRQQVYEGEIRKRNLLCTEQMIAWEASKEQMNRARNDAMATWGAQTIINAQPQRPAVPAPVICDSRVVGNTVQTYCN